MFPVSRLFTMNGLQMQIFVFGETRVIVFVCVVIVLPLNYLVQAVVPIDLCLG